MRQARAEDTATFEMDAEGRDGECEEQSHQLPGSGIEGEYESPPAQRSDQPATGSRKALQPFPVPPEKHKESDIQHGPGQKAQSSCHQQPPHTAHASSRASTKIPKQKQST